MNDLKPFKHGQEGTHYSCDVALQEGLGCCGCSMHDCPEEGAQGYLALENDEGCPLKGRFGQCADGKCFHREWDLAEWLHQRHEKHAHAEGWNTQKSTKVEFVKLPNANKQVMLLLARDIIQKFREIRRLK